MNRLSVTSLARSDDNDQIVQCAEAIGKSTYRLQVFEAVYRGKKLVRSVSDIMIDTGLSNKQVRAALKHLEAHHMCVLSGRGDNLDIEKDSFCKKYRDKIVLAVTKPEYRDKLPTKRSKIGQPVKEKPFFPRKISKSSARRQPSKLSVVFLTTNPHRDLRTDIEYRAVFSRYKDSINREDISIQNFAAASFDDLLTVLNELAPDILHFSGHGDVGLVVFDDATLDGDAHEVEFDLLKSALEATDNPPKLVVLNSCFGAIAAVDLLGKVEAVVAMNDSIDDTAASAFARQLYSAIFSGQSLTNAVEQGRIALRAMQLPDADYPELVVSSDYQANEIRFL